tara:strand:+ start:173 stop:754 length:582 start_codon:yes stop_codon:yes gene_type:complete
MSTQYIKRHDVHTANGVEKDPDCKECVQQLYYEMHESRFTQSSGTAYMFTVTMRDVSAVSSLKPGVSVTAPVNYSIDKDHAIAEYKHSEKQPTLTAFLKAIDKLTDKLKKCTTYGVVSQEKGKTGRRHAHMVIKCEDEQKMQMLDAMWQHNSTIGKVIMSREIKDEFNAIRYIIKYTLKDFYKDKMSEREWSW